jgi:hypothetical protein
MSKDETLFIVSAKGPYGVFWLSEPSALELRTLVTRDLAQLFPTVEEAQSAINKMPSGYKLAGVSFAVEYCDASAETRLLDEMRVVRPNKREEPETISAAESRTVADLDAGPKASRKWLSWATLAGLWQH